MPPCCPILPDLHPHVCLPTRGRRQQTSDASEVLLTRTFQLGAWFVQYHARPFHHPPGPRLGMNPDIEPGRSSRWCSWRCRCCGWRSSGSSCPSYREPTTAVKSSSQSATRGRSPAPPPWCSRRMLPSTSRAYHYPEPFIVDHNLCGDDVRESMSACQRYVSTRSSRCSTYTNAVNPDLGRLWHAAALLVLLLCLRRLSSNTRLETYYYGAGLGSGSQWSCFKRSARTFSTAATSSASCITQRHATVPHTVPSRCGCC